MKSIFYIVDVFAENKYAGNQLAVVRDARVLADADMQRIAKEMNYSETTFILSDKKQESGYAVHIFTPEIERGSCVSFGNDFRFRLLKVENDNAYKGKSRYSYFYVPHRSNNHKKSRFGSSTQSPS